jgi:hypothetical protein
MNNIQKKVLVSALVQYAKGADSRFISKQAKVHIAQQTPWYMQPGPVGADVAPEEMGGGSPVRSDSTSGDLGNSSTDPMKQLQSEVFGTGGVSNPNGQDVQGTIQSAVMNLYANVTTLAKGLYGLDLSEVEAMKLVKEAIKNISNSIADIPIGYFVDRIDAYLNNVEKGTQGAKALSGDSKKYFKTESEDSTEDSGETKFSMMKLSRKRSESAMPRRYTEPYMRLLKFSQAAQDHPDAWSLPSGTIFATDGYHDMTGVKADVFMVLVQGRTLLYIMTAIIKNDSAPSLFSMVRKFKTAFQFNMADILTASSYDEVMRIIHDSGAETYQFMSHEDMPNVRVGVVIRQGWGASPEGRLVQAAIPFGYLSELYSTNNTDTINIPEDAVRIRLLGIPKQLRKQLKPLFQQLIDSGDAILTYFPMYGNEIIGVTAIGNERLESVEYQINHIDDFKNTRFDTDTYAGEHRASVSWDENDDRDEFEPFNEVPIDEDKKSDAEEDLRRWVMEHRNKWMYADLEPVQAPDKVNLNASKKRSKKPPWK